MEPIQKQESSRFGASKNHQQHNPNNLSSSSSAFVSASQSPFFSPRSPTSSSCLDSAIALSSESNKYGPQSCSSTSNDAFSPQPMILPQIPNPPPNPANPSSSSAAADIRSTSHGGPCFIRTGSESQHMYRESSCDALGRKIRPLARNPSNPAKKVSISRTRASLSSSARYRNCDVYIGTHGRKRSLLCFTKWLRAELELQGIASFATDRARYADARSHDIADRAISSATFGVVIVTRRSFSNPYTIEELKIFLGRKNLVPVFFDLGSGDCLARDIIERRGELWEKQGGDLWRLYGGDEKQWRDAVEGLSRVNEDWRLEANGGNWRSCVTRAVSLLGSRLGRRSVTEREKGRRTRFQGEEFPYPRNPDFVGRKRELLELEAILFGTGEEEEEDDDVMDIKIRPRRRDSVIVRRRSGRSRKKWENRRVSESDRLQDHVGKMVDRRKSEADKWEIKDTEKRGSGSGSKCKGKELFVWKESEKEIEIHSGKHLKKTGDQRARNLHKARYGGRRNHDLNQAYGRGIACVTGEAGIGKTELVLEFAYRFAERYRMVLWVGGEARYLRQNYLNLSFLLGLDVGTETHMGSEKNKNKTFEEQEMEAIQRVKKELARDIPYLLVIENLESERDWWDGRNLLELLPRFGGPTHVIISTRLSRVMNLDPLRVSYLSSIEAMSLMKGKRRDFTVAELDMLRTIEDKLGRLTLGLAVVGSILSELPITPSRLYDTINRVPWRDVMRSIQEDSTLRNHPFLMQLLDVCFTILDHADEEKCLATRMALVGAWFAPFPIPISLLANAARRLSHDSRRQHLWRRCWHLMGCFCGLSKSRKPELEAAYLLIRFGIAKSTTRHGWIQFPQIVQLYSRKKEGSSAARAMFQAVLTRGFISQHQEHMLAACFLVLKFGNAPVVVEPRVSDLLVFVKKAIVPLAVHFFTTFSMCQASTELLRISTKLLEAAEESFVSQVPNLLDKSSCWRQPRALNTEVDEFMWQAVTLLKASLLEIRAKLMLKGGLYDVGEDLCRSCISIRTVLLGSDHPETMASQETLAKLVRYQTNIRFG